MENIKKRLDRIYENQNNEPVYQAILKRIKEVKEKNLPARKQNWDESDVVLITYGDQFREEGRPNLDTFKKVFDEYLADKFGVVHILPFYPYTSDDGFSVQDYKMVNPPLGDWSNVAELNKSTRIMFDYVCNHISSKSEWFQGYLNQDPKYANYFTEMDPSIDLSAVTRPRALPLLSKFTLKDGQERYVWTTFSDDQIDLNFSSTDLLVDMIDVLLFYIEQGAEYVRLDAVGFMWKEVGTNCIHHEKTHEIVKLFREILDEAAEGTLIITETNVPHKDNISYFGNGNDEAHMIYQFPLPPLVLNAIHNGDGKYLTKWAKDLESYGDKTTFFNFLASHDGIGMNPVRGIIPEEEIIALVDDLKKEGALVNYKKNPDGSESPYEINVTYMDALSKQSDSDDLRAKKFLLAHSILLTFPGVPAVYVQSMLGSRNHYAGVEETGMNRSINRRKYNFDEIISEINDSSTLRNKVFSGLTEIIKIRKTEKIFHPNAGINVLDLSEKVFAFERSIENEKVVVLHNLSNENVVCDIKGEFVDLVTGRNERFQENKILKPYEFVWLKQL